MSEEEKIIILKKKQLQYHLSYEDELELFNIIEKQQKEIEELKKDKLELINKNHVVHLKDVEKELREMRNGIDIKNTEINMLNNMIDISYISKNKIKAKIEELEKEQEDNRKSLYNAVNNLRSKEIDKISDRICVNMAVRDILQSLLEEK